MRPATIIRRYMTYKGYSYSKVAELTGCSYQYIQQLDQGKRVPNMHWCRILERVLDIPPGDLYLSIAYPTPDPSEFDRTTDEPMPDLRPPARCSTTNPTRTTVSDSHQRLDARQVRGVEMGGSQTAETISDV